MHLFISDKMEDCIKKNYPDYEYSGKKNEEMERINKDLFKYPNILTVGHFVIVGSFLDGSPSFFLKKESFDLDILWCLPKRDGSIDGLSITETEKLLAEPIDSKYPVFFRMCASNIESLDGGYSYLLDDSGNLSTEKIKKQAIENMPLLKGSDSPPVGKASIPFKQPVSRFVNYYRKGHTVDQGTLDSFDSWFKHIDIVPAIPCQGWPPIKACQNRLEKIRSVDPNLAKLLEEHGFHLITKSKCCFESRDSIWMISFARAESILAGYMDEFSRKCLSLLKILLQDLQVIQDKDDQTDKDSLKSYYFKTAFYWWWIGRKEKAKKERKEKAKKDNLGESMVSLLEYCRDKLNDRALPMFWLQDYDLFSDVDKKVLKKANKNICSFLHSPFTIKPIRKVLIQDTDQHVDLHRIHIEDDRKGEVSIYVFSEIMKGFHKLYTQPQTGDASRQIKELLNSTLAGVTQMLKYGKKCNRTEILKPEDAVEQLLKRMDSKPHMKAQFENTFKLVSLFFEIVFEICIRKFNILKEQNKWQLDALKMQMEWQNLVAGVLSILFPPLVPVFGVTMLANLCMVMIH